VYINYQKRATLSVPYVEISYKLTAPRLANSWETYVASGNAPCPVGRKCSSRCIRPVTGWPNAN